MKDLVNFLKGLAVIVACVLIRVAFERTSMRLTNRIIKDCFPWNDEEKGGAS